MKDLKYLYYFEELLRNAYNDTVREAKAEGRICVASMCENTPEPLFNLGSCFSVRLTAPNTSATEVATYYMTNMMCETARALLERAIEGGFNFADCLIAPDGCTMINRAAENIELLKAMDEGKPNFFHEHMEIPLKADENGVKLLKIQCENHILTPLHQHFGVDCSDAAIRKAVDEHNEICRIINAIGEYRKEELPRITGYEYAVLTLATYVCPKDKIKDKLQETLEEIKDRKPDEKKHRARVVLVGSEMDDPDFVKMVEEAGAYVCADRYCFGSRPGRVEIELNDTEDALTQVCRHYTYQSQCPRVMNMDKVYGRKAYVADLAKEFNADGIIYTQVKFCDPWGYEKVMGQAMLKEDYGYPVMTLDRPYNSKSSAGQTRTRVQAFVESIEVKKMSAREGK